MKAVLRAAVKFFREADVSLLALSLISSVFGIILISSVAKSSDTGSGDVYRQIAALAVGVVLFVIFSYVDIDIIADKLWLLLIFSILFIMTLYFWGVGEEDTGNKAWLRFLGTGIQPAEIVKITFIVIIAKIITNFKERKTLDNFSSIFRITIVFLIIFGLLVVVSRDLGSGLVYGFIFVVMMYIGGVKLRWFLIEGGFVAAVSPLVWVYYLTEKQQNRIEALINPDKIDPSMSDALWHTKLSADAISSGGFTGNGLGQGRLTQAGVIPAQRTDFIFSAAGEELGFVGCILIMALLVAIIARCIYIGAKSNNSLGLLVCVGVAAMLISQTFENIGMCLGLLPVVGLPLPFFSYGGSSMVACMAAMGIVSGIKMRPKPVRFRNN